MPPEARPSLRKTVTFFLFIGTMFVGAVALSAYKIAVANAYVTRKLPPAAESYTPAATADVARGAHVADLVGCADCHGADYSGRALVDQAGYATVVAPNITAGQGGRGRTLDDRALARVLRSGLDGENRMLWGMPRQSLLALSQDDVWALVGFVRSLPPVDTAARQNQLAAAGYLDVALRRLRLVDRTPIPLVPPKVPRPTVGLDNAVTGFGSEPQEYARWRRRSPEPGTEPFGAYVRAISGCTACHGAKRPQVGRTAAAPLRLGREDVRRCQVAARLGRLTSQEVKAMFEGL